MSDAAEHSENPSEILIDQVEDLLRGRLPLPEDMSLKGRSLVSIVSMRGRKNVQDDISSLYGKEIIHELRNFHKHLQHIIDERTSTLRDEAQARGRAEQQARESLEMYRALADSAEDDIFIITPEYRVQYCNAYASRKFGKAPEEIIGRFIVDVFPPPIAERMIGNIGLAFNAGEPVQREGYFEFGGRPCWLHTKLVPLRDDQGNIQAVMGMSRDITARKLSENAAIEQLENYRNLFDATFEGIVVHDKGLILDCNEAAASMFGATRAQVIGRQILDFADLSSRQQIQSRIEQNSEEAYEATGLKLNGETFRLQARGGTIVFNKKTVRLAGLRKLPDVS